MLAAFCDQDRMLNQLLENGQRWNVRIASWPGFLLSTLRLASADLGQRPAALQCLQMRAAKLKETGTFRHVEASIPKSSRVPEEKHASAKPALSGERDPENRELRNDHVFLSPACWCLGGGLRNEMTPIVFFMLIVTYRKQQENNYIHIYIYTYVVIVIIIIIK